MAACQTPGIVGEEAGHASNIRWASRQLLKKYGKGVLSRVFRTVGDSSMPSLSSLSAQPMLPLLTRAVMFRLASFWNQHFNPLHAFSSQTMSFTLAYYRLVQGWDSNVIAKDHRMFCKCDFASVEDRFDVAAPGDSSSARMWSSGSSSCQRSLSGGGERMVGACILPSVCSPHGFRVSVLWFLVAFWMVSSSALSSGRVWRHFGF